MPLELSDFMALGRQRQLYRAILDILRSEDRKANPGAGTHGDDIVGFDFIGHCRVVFLKEPGSTAARDLRSALRSKNPTVRRTSSANAAPFPCGLFLSIRLLTQISVKAYGLPARLLRHGFEAHQDVPLQYLQVGPQRAAFKSTSFHI